MAFLIVPFCFFICVATATDSRMPQPIQFYSHSKSRDQRYKGIQNSSTFLFSKNTEEGPNPWKTVIIFEELGISYGTTFLEFGAAKGGVEHSDYLKKILAGRVPLIWDPSTGERLSGCLHTYLLSDIANAGDLYERRYVNRV